MSYFFYQGKTDMRMSFDALSGLVQREMKRNPMSGEVFVFVSRRRDRVKMLHWEAGGFVLYYKRLEKGTFEIPVFDPGTSEFRIKWSSLMMMVEGISVQRIKLRKRFTDERFVDNYVDKNNI